MAGILDRGIQIDGLGMKSFMTYESNVLFALRFMIDCNVVGGNWIEVPAGKYKKTAKNLSYCQLEFDCLYPSWCILCHKNNRTLSLIHFPKSGWECVMDRFTREAGFWMGIPSKLYIFISLKWWLVLEEVKGWWCFRSMLMWSFLGYAEHIKY